MSDLKSTGNHGSFCGRPACACKVLGLLELGGSATSYSQVARSPVTWQKDTATQGCWFTSNSGTRHRGGQALNNCNCHDEGVQGAPPTHTTARVATAAILASELRSQE